MPKLKKQSLRQRNKSRSLLMRQRRDDTAMPDEGRDDPTDPQWSVPVAASAAGSSGLGADELSEPSVLGALYQTEVKARLSKPFGPSAPYDMPYEMPYEMPCEMPCELPESKSKKLPDNSLHQVLDKIPNNISSHLSCDVHACDNSVQTGNHEQKDLTESNICIESAGSNYDKFNRTSEIIFQCENAMSVPVHQSSDLSQDFYIATPVSIYNTLRPEGSDVFIRGSFHQADNLFSTESKGSQCTVNALCGLIYAHYSKLRTSKDLDKVLLNGDLLYKTNIHDLQARGIFKSRLLNFDELPKVVNIFNKEIVINKLDVVSGVCTTQFATSHLPSLYQALYTAFLNCSYLLIMIGSVCSAVFKMDGQYFFFDSHSHGVDGLSHDNGTSVLISFHRIEDLVTYMYAVYNSMLVDVEEQFDILPVHFGSGICKQAEDRVESNEWETVTYKKNNKSKRFQNNASEKKSIENSTSKNQPNLIGKYFKDQKQQHEQKQIKKQNLFDQQQEQNKIRNQKLTDRNEYFRLYRRKKRQSADFKKNEKEYSLESKRKARESADFKKNEQVSKSKARQSADFKKNEKEYSLESKRKARESADFKKNEKEYSLESKRKARESADFKKNEKILMESKRKARESADFKKNEKEYSLESKRKARESADFKKNEKDTHWCQREKLDSQQILRKMKKNTHWSQREKLESQQILRKMNRCQRVKLDSQQILRKMKKNTHWSQREKLDSRQILSKKKQYFKNLQSEEPD